MQLQNHRVAMQTRISHRYGLSRITSPEVITPCAGIQVGNAYDTYTFIPNAETGMLFVLNKNNQSRANWYNTPVVTGGTLGSLRRSAQNATIGTANPILQEIVGMVPGQPVTVTYTETSTGPDAWMPGRCLMGLMCATPGASGKGWFSVGADARTMGSSVGATPQVTWTQPSEALMLIATTTLSRGMPIVDGKVDYYNHTSELDHVICSGSNVDTELPSWANGIQTGGYYKFALFKTSGRADALGQMDASWDAPNQTEPPGASYAYLLAMREHDAVLTGWAPKP